jgi:hypothetical protein
LPPPPLKQIKKRLVALDDQAQSWVFVSMRFAESRFPRTRTRFTRREAAARLGIAAVIKSRPKPPGLRRPSPGLDFAPAASSRGAAASNLVL